MKLVAAILLVLCLASGCSSSRGLHAELLHQVLEQDASRLAGAQPQAALPARPGQAPATKLGLYVTPTGFLRHGFEWTDRDRESVLSWANGLPHDGPRVTASFIPLTSLKGYTLAQLRDAAARYGVDRLVIIDGAAAVDRYNNYKAPLLYWTILGAYLADGTHSDALCVVRGALWDVQKGVLLASEAAEGRAQTVGPAALVDDDTVVRKARQQALDALLAKLAGHVAKP